METYLIVYGIIITTLLLFLFGPWKYDIVALMALFVLSLLGIVTPKEAFSGFAHPVIWTVIGVLIISKGLINSGLINIISRKLDFVGKKTKNKVATLTIITGTLSMFINNIGSLASLIPIAKNMSQKKDTLSKFLMPMAFASLLGGMVTLIGSPPNIIIALYRAQVYGTPFKVFDFFPVGIGVAIVGIAFISIIGWRLVPTRKNPIKEENEIENYKAEILIQKNSKAEGKTLNELLKLSKSQVKINSILRKERLLKKGIRKLKLKKGDILIVTGSTKEIIKLVEVARLQYATSKKLNFFSEKDIVIEAVVSPKSSLINKKLETTLSNKRFNVSILSIASSTKKSERILGTVMKAGNVIVFQGKESDICRAMKELNCQPLKERWIRFGKTPRIITSLLIFGLAIFTASFRILPVEIAFIGAAILMILTRLTTMKESYSKTIDWSIIVLLGAMIPIGIALEKTGGAKVLSELTLNLIGNFAPWTILLFLMVITMILSNIINNVSTAILMAPISVGIANILNVSKDPFLMTIAIGASAAFLTPIGHQSCTLVLNEGGYKFKDYWKLGLPLSVIVIGVSIPLILYFWPL